MGKQEQCEGVRACQVDEGCGVSVTSTSVAHVGERCTSTPHNQHESTQRGHAQRGHAQQVHATRARGAQARTRMHSTRTKHRPAHPRDVDDVDERRHPGACTGALHAQHEGAQLGHAGVRSAGHTERKPEVRAQGGHARGARGRMHAHGACRAPPIGHSPARQCGKAILAADF